ncbi:Non-heme chloroperoxidase [compost metagenome]
MMGGAKAHYDGIVAFSQTDFTADLQAITIPVLVMHGHAAEAPETHGLEWALAAPECPEKPMAA